MAHNQDETINNNDNNPELLHSSHSSPDLAGHGPLSPAQNLQLGFSEMTNDSSQDDHNNNNNSTCCVKQPHDQAQPEAKAQQEQPKATPSKDKVEPKDELRLKPYVYKSCNAIVRKHGYKHGAFSFIWRRFLRVLFTQSLPIYLPIHCLPIVLFKRKQLVQTPKTVLWSLLKANVKSCLFLSSFQTLFIAVVCLGNYCLKNDSPMTAVVSGLLAPLSILFENENRRKEMMLYCVPRVGEILQRLGVESQWFNEMSWDNAVLVLFSLSMGVLMYYYHRDSTGRTIKPSIRSLISLTLGY